MDLHERLRRAREAAGHTNASEFARLIGVAPNSVYRYERGDQKPSVDVARAWSRETSVSLDWLLAGKGKAPEPPAESAAELAPTGTGGL